MFSIDSIRGMRPSFLFLVGLSGFWTHSDRASLSRWIQIIQPLTKQFWEHMCLLNSVLLSKVDMYRYNMLRRYDRFDMDWLCVPIIVLSAW